MAFYALATPCIWDILVAQAFQIQGSHGLKKNACEG